MSWFFLSLLCAASLATSDALTKRYFGPLSPYEMGFVRLCCALVWLGGAAFFIHRPELDAVFLR